MTDDTLRRAHEDPATDPEAAATIDELIDRGKADYDGLRDAIGRWRGGAEIEDVLPEVLEHAGGLVETIGEAKPHIDTKGEREEVAREILERAGVDGTIATIAIAAVKGLVRLWRKRRDEREGGSASAVPRLER